MTVDISPRLPGRLGTPNMTLQEDPRADPRMVALLLPLGVAGALPPSPVSGSSSLSEILESISTAEAGFGALFEAIAMGMPPVEGVTHSVETIRGVDGNDITVYVHRPASVQGALPAVVHFHGGGMVMLGAADAGFVRWRDELAASGLVVFGVEFRNGGGRHGAHPFPAGLNDCVSAVRWVADNKKRLGVSKIVVSGESGGGNLTLATMLKAKRDGRIADIAGAYAMCPYISDAYAVKLPELPSLYENDGYLIECVSMGAQALAYDPERENATNPLAWPYYATGQDLEGLPPHVISVNQLDPLRDEGLAYFRKLLDAGVSVASRTVNGTCHAGDMMCGRVMPDVTRATIRDIKGFAQDLAEASRS